MESLSCCAAHESITAAQIPYILAGVKFLLLQLIDACNMILQLSPQSTQTHFSIVITNSFNTMFQYCCPPPVQGSAPKCCSTAMFAPAKVTGAAAADAQTCLVDTLMRFYTQASALQLACVLKAKSAADFPLPPWPLDASFPAMLEDSSSPKLPGPSSSGRAARLRAGLISLT